jgi:DNA mismatch repair protein MutS|tara:strand:- start:44107 stop:46863 length:2757 start_codon:yes stop_codon:yes gene_type:complete
MIYDEYLEHCEKYKRLYKDVDTLVLMEVGGFFEIYGVDNDDETSGADMNMVSSLLNMTVTRKNKNIPKNSRTNPLMTGFPSHSLKKFLDILIASNFTVILIEQFNTGKRTTYERKATRVYSPSTYTDNIITYMENMLMIVYLEKLDSFDEIMSKFVISYSVVDISTGKSITNTLYSPGDLLENELIRLHIQYNPKEIVYISSVSYNIPFPKHNMIHNKIGKLEKSYTTLSYQTEILKKLFPNTGLLSAIEFVNMESKPFELISFVYMIQFLYQHNEKSLEKLNKPDCVSQDGQLILHGDTVHQLNIWGNKKSLIELINNCVSNIGKRYFKNKMLNPITNVTTLKHEYDMIQYFIENERYIDTRDKLKNVCDIERIMHKEILSPSQLMLIYSSINIIINICHDLTTLKNKYLSDDEFNLLNTFLSDIDEHFVYSDASKMVCHQITENIFKKCDPKILETEDEIKQLQMYFEQEYSVLKKYVKCEKNDKDGYVFTTTHNRYKELQKKDSRFHTITQTKNQVKIFHVELAKNNEKYVSKRVEYVQMLDDYYNKIVSSLLSKHSEILHKSIKFIEHIDFYTTNAYNAVKYKYTKPIIEGYSTKMKVTQMRHPIIERIQDNLLYVPNDLSFEDECYGKLIFGINSSGKSSLMKSLGLTLLMAQSGMYVPADSFVFHPYTAIFTRISSSDDLYKSQSTFTTEMLELRNILNFSDERSLILGDELCSGTESVSAVSLVASGILKMINNKSTFILASHLHELTKISHINESPNLKIHHLSIRYDELTNVIYYERILKEGSSDTLYGLEVCKSLDMPRDFLLTANMIRHNVLEMNTDFVKNKKSKYNAKIFEDMCTVCKQKASEVHHIKYQKYADTNGMNGTQKKNVKHNLVTLCEKCHYETHCGKLDILGYITTSDGIQLSYAFKD